MIWTPERRQLALASLARWHGTPHHNRICEIGVGVDCIKFVYAVLCESQIVPSCDFSGYDVNDGMWGESTRLQDTMMKVFHSVWIESDFQFGDVPILKNGKRSAHCGFYTADGYMWHSLGHRFVTKSDFGLWKREIRGMVRITETGFKIHPRNIKL